MTTFSRKTPEGGTAYFLLTRGLVLSAYPSRWEILLGVGSTMDGRPRVTFAIGLPWEWRGWHVYRDSMRWARGFFALTLPGGLPRHPKGSGPGREPR